MPDRRLLLEGALIMRFVAFAVLLSIISLSCVNNNGPVDPLDPNTKPVVMSTYPPNGGVGPFNIHDLSRNDLPYFYIHFGKLMNSRTLDGPSIKIDGWGDNAYVSPGFSFSSTDALVSFYVYQTRGQYGSALAQFKVGQRYTVSLDTTVSDFNGNHLVRPYSFSFTPEPLFRVTSTSPIDGDTLRTGSPITVTFNNGIRSDNFSKLKITPFLSGTWARNYDDSSIVQFYWSEGLRASTVYTLAIDGSAADSDGHILGQAFSTVFSTVSFRLYSSSIYSGYPYYSDRYPLDLDPRFVFTAAIDTESVRNGFSISPTVAGVIHWSGDGFEYDPSRDFAENTQYSLTLTTAIRSVDGSSLLFPKTYSFRTDYFRLGYASPSDGGTDFHTNNYWYMQFTGRVDTATLRASFSVQPALRGHFSATGSSVYYYPDEQVKPHTYYYFAFDTTLRSIGGYHLAYPDTVRFRTGE